MRRRRSGRSRRGSRKPTRRTEPPSRRTPSSTSDSSEHLDAGIAKCMATVPTQQRKLVTGRHDPPSEKISPPATGSTWRARRSPCIRPRPSRTRPGPQHPGQRNPKRRAGQGDLSRESTQSEAGGGDRLSDGREARTTLWTGDTLVPPIPAATPTSRWRQARTPTRWSRGSPTVMPTARFRALAEVLARTEGLAAPTVASPSSSTRTAVSNSGQCVALLGPNGGGKYNPDSRPARRTSADAREG